MCKRCCRGSGKVLVGPPSSDFCNSHVARAEQDWGKSGEQLQHLGMVLPPLPECSSITGYKGRPIFPRVSSYSEYSIIIWSASTLPFQQAAPSQCISVQPSKFHQMSQCCVPCALKPSLLARPERKPGVTTWSYKNKDCHMVSSRRADLLSVCFPVSCSFLKLFKQF